MIITFELEDGSFEGTLHTGQAPVIGRLLRIPGIIDNLEVIKMRKILSPRWGLMGRHLILRRVIPLTDVEQMAEKAKAAEVPAFTNEWFAAEYQRYTIDHFMERKAGAYVNPAYDPSVEHHLACRIMQRVVGFAGGCICKLGQRAVEGKLPVRLGAHTSECDLVRTQGGICICHVGKAATELHDKIKPHASAIKDMITAVPYVKEELYPAGENVKPAGFIESIVGPGASVAEVAGMVAAMDGNKYHEVRSPYGRCTIAHMLWKRGFMKYLAHKDAAKASELEKQKGEIASWVSPDGKWVLVFPAIKTLHVDKDGELNGIGWIMINAYVRCAAYCDARANAMERAVKSTEHLSLPQYENDFSRSYVQANRRAADQFYQWAVAALLAEEELIYDRGN